MPELPGLDEGQASSSTVWQYEVLGQGFTQPYAYVTSGYVGHNISLPTHTDNNVTLVMFYVPERKGLTWESSGGIWYDLTYGFRVPFAANTAVLFQPHDLHGTVAFEESSDTTVVALTTDDRLIKAWDWWVEQFCES